MRWLDNITISMDMSFEQTLGDREGQGILACAAVQGVAKSQTLFSHWIATKDGREVVREWVTSNEKDYHQGKLNFILGEDMEIMVVEKRY